MPHLKTWLFIIIALLVGSSFPAHAEGEVDWRHQAKSGDVMLMANSLGKAARTAFYEARGFAAETIRPYAQACGFSFGMKNDGSTAIRTHLVDWQVVGADGRNVALRLPEAWDSKWEKAGVSQSARIAFRWAQFQSENIFEPGDWIMGMATLEAIPTAPFRLVARYRYQKAEHEITIEKLECARD